METRELQCLAMMRNFSGGTLCFIWSLCEESHFKTQESVNALYDFLVERILNFDFNLEDWEIALKMIDRIDEFGSVLEQARHEHVLDHAGPNAEKTVIIPLWMKMAKAATRSAVADRNLRSGKSLLIPRVLKACSYSK